MARHTSTLANALQFEAASALALTAQELGLSHPQALASLRLCFKLANAAAKTCGSNKNKRTIQKACRRRGASAMAVGVH